MGRGLHAESRQIIQRAYDNLEVEHPSGVRRVAYALYGNQAGAMVKKLGRLLVRARKDGDIPWEWINDSTRLDVLPFVVNDAGDMRDVHRSCPSYDPWQQQPVRVIVWTEKSVGGTLEPVLDSFLVGFCVHHGNTSASKIQAVVSAMATDQRRLVILYCGDHDAKGLRISEDDLPKRFAEYGADMDRLTIRRVALLQADAERLIEFKDEFKPKDKDVKWYRAHCGLSYGVELEAIPSTELRQRVETAIRQEIVDIGAWNQVLATSTAVRESWEAYVDKWKAPVPAAPLPMLPTASEMPHFPFEVALGLDWYLWCWYLVSRCAADLEGTAYTVAWWAGRFATVAEMIGAHSWRQDAGLYSTDNSALEEWEQFAEDHQACSVAEIQHRLRRGVPG